jgi:hypothetical protein
MLQVRGLFGVGVGVGRGVSVVVGIGVEIGIGVGVAEGVGEGVTAQAGCRPTRQRAATAETATNFDLAPLI